MRLASENVTPWSVWLPGRPPSWNKSYRIVRQRRGTSEAYYHTLAKTSELIKYQQDMAMIVRAARPSWWKPVDRYICIMWSVYLERQIDMDNLQKAVNDVLQMATGIDDKWFYPVFAHPVVGVPRKGAGIGLTVDFDDRFYRWFEKATGRATHGSGPDRPPADADAVPVATPPLRVGQSLRGGRGPRP